MTLEMSDFYPTINATETTPKQPQNTPHPPTKIDILWDLYQERERLKNLREEIATGQRKPDKEVTTELFITQIVIQTNKAMIDALKETNINLTQNNYTQVDISAQVNDLIQFSRERQCSRQKLTVPS